MVVKMHISHALAFAKDKKKQKVNAMKHIITFVIIYTIKIIL